MKALKVEREAERIWVGKKLKLVGWLKKRARCRIVKIVKEGEQKEGESCKGCVFNTKQGRSACFDLPDCVGIIFKRIE